MKTTYLLVGLLFLSFAFADGDEDTESLGPVIGIDLGTTYSCVGIYKNGRVEIIANELGNRITPSFVAFTDDERLVGEAAKNQASSNPDRSIYSVKRLIGRDYKDKEVQQDKKLLPYSIVDRNGKPYIESSVVGGATKQMAPEELRPYIGAGFNYTIFYGVDEGPVLDAIDYDNSFGLAFQGGIDFDLDEKWFLNLDAKYITMNTDVTVDATTALGATVGADVDINPLVIGFGIGMKF